MTKALPARIALALALLSALVLAGCFSGSKSGPPSGSTTAASQAAPTDAEEQQKDLEPYDAPALEELDAKVEWEEMPVIDALERLRERQAKEQPLATVEEALALQNTSAEANAKIISALGRLPATDADANEDATLVLHSRADVKSTNPILASTVIEAEYLNLTGFEVFAFDWNMIPFASSRTVKSWHTSKDRLYDKVVLRDDLTWSDGEPITAHDVVFSFQTIMNPKVPVPAQRSGTDQIRWIEAYDDHTLVYFHKLPLATNIWNVNFNVIPKHIYEKSLHEDYTLQNSPYHVKYESNPVCGGPYVLTHRTTNQEMVLERREDWYMHNGVQIAERPYFAEIRFQILVDDNTALLALKEGKIHEVEIQAEQWMTQTTGPDFYRRNTKVIGLPHVTYSFTWNCKEPFFSDKRVRQAMSYAFDHNEMLQKLLYGLDEPAVGLFHPSLWYGPKNPPEPYNQDLNKAEDLLEEAGWSDHDGDGILDKEIDGRVVPFEFNVLTMNVTDRIRICELLKENLDRIGIICTVQPVEFTTLQEKLLNHDFQAAFGGWGAGADPDTSENLYATNQDRNFGQYSNPEVDRLFVEGKKEFDREKRAEIYHKISALMWEDQPETWLYYRKALFGFNKDLRGYGFSPRGPYSYSPGFFSLWMPAQ